MRKIINKIILPIVLIAAVAAFEAGCQYLCRALMPDETDEFYTYSKSTNTQLMVINDEDDSRFYPRMAAINSETMTVSDYLDDLYAQQFMIYMLSNSEKLKAQLIRKCGTKV